MQAPYFADYEAPVYVPYNRDKTLNPAFGHASNCLYTDLDLERKIHEALPEKYQSAKAYPDAVHRHIEELIINMTADLQAAYHLYLNKARVVFMTEGQLRGFKNAPSNMRVQAIIRQTQELFFPVTWETLKKFVEEQDSEDIDQWAENLRERADKTLRRIASTYHLTVGTIPTAPEGGYIGPEVDLAQEVLTSSTPQPAPLVGDAPSY
jgi:hypothetical protein